MIRIRLELPSDAPLVRIVNEKAFMQPAEADIVDALRRACPDSLSLVAEDGDSLAGHILFSPVVIDRSGPRIPKCIRSQPQSAITNPQSIKGMGLAPMAVLPGHQKRGIGSALVKRGLEILSGRGCPFVIVLGHPGYYPRFGFEPASWRGVSCQWEGVPDEAFMVLILDEASMKDVSGVARYRDEFNEAM